MRKLWVLSLVTVLFAVLAGSARADDWVADKLRGPVLQLIDRQWQPLARGMIVPDSRMIRTLAAGHVTFTRGDETIEVSPNTQIQIVDKASSKPFTTVKQSFGTVSIKAQVQNVQHFSVVTPYLAAVVKGTRFIVTSGKTGTSVEVRRGHVEVDNYADKTHVLIAVGQSAVVDTVTTTGATVVSGSGKLPVVLDRFGKPVTATSSTKAGSNKVSEAAHGSSASSGNGIGVSVDSRGNGVSAHANAGGVSAGAGAGNGGVSVGASVGGTSVGVTAGAGGVNVDLGRIHVGL